MIFSSAILFYIRKINKERHPMQNESRQLTRQSPYLKANILKYAPSSLIPPDGNTRNHL